MCVVLQEDHFYHLSQSFFSPLHGYGPHCKIVEFTTFRNAWMRSIFFKWNEMDFIKQASNLKSSTVCVKDILIDSHILDLARDRVKTK